MSGKTLDNKLLDKEILNALVLMSKNKSEGVRYIEFVKQGNMFEATELINKGYARRVKSGEIVPKGEKDSNYKLTKKGNDYLRKILKFAYKEFDNYI